MRDRVFDGRVTTGIGNVLGFEPATQVVVALAKDIWAPGVTGEECLNVRGSKCGDGEELGVLLTICSGDV